VPRIRFQFSPEKTVQAASYLLRELGGQTSKIKLMKLLYYADRDHFLAAGRPITGDEQWALPHGPVPTRTLDLLNGTGREEDHDLVFTHITAHDRRFELHDDPGTSMLQDSDKRVLDSVLSDHGQKHPMQLRAETHDLPEYIDARRNCAEQSSAPIWYELILEHHSRERGFRRGRAVITPEIAAHMNCPFPQSEQGL
jgi:uncharacterized phage-associated protein